MDKQMSKERLLLWNIIKEFRYDQCDRFDLEFDYEEFFLQTLDEVLKNEIKQKS